MKKVLCALFSVGMFSLMCFGAGAPAAGFQGESVTDEPAQPMSCMACIRAGGSCCGINQCC